MEVCHELEIAHKSLRKSGNTAVFFTQGEASFAVYDVERDVLKSKTLDEPILNVEFADKSIYVFHEHVHRKYKAGSLEVEEESRSPNVTSRFSVAGAAYYIGRDEISVEKNGVAKKKAIDSAFLMDKDHLFVAREGQAVIYTRGGKAYTAPLKDTRNVCADIRNNKVYILQGDRIYGHDLNLYLDVLGDFRPSRFTNLENELFLFDGEELRLYQKNLSVQLFRCPADDYSYSESQQRLYVLHGGKFYTYDKINYYARNFGLVDRSTVYEEQEDEFDESDSSHVDIGHVEGRRKQLQAVDSD